MEFGSIEYVAEIPVRVYKTQSYRLNDSAEADSDSDDQIVVRMQDSLDEQANMRVKKRLDTNLICNCF